MKLTREQIQQLFIRVCRDSGFTLSASRAAVLAGDASGLHAMEFWLALPSLTVMEEIAAGTHPAAGREALSNKGSDK